MPSQLQLFNTAFAHLGESTVPQITGDPKPANVVKAFAAWPLALDTGLARHPWLCGLQRMTIARSASADGDWQYDYVYELPVDTLRIWTVKEGNTFAWERSTVVTGAFVGRPVIRSSYAGPLKVAIVRRTIPELLTPLLADAIGYELASRLAGPIQSDAKLAAQLKDKADTAYALAQGSEAGEHGGDDIVITSPMADARSSAH
ncbi:hypothetical protein [Phenylobacterium sp.]|uniref:hypothetical protein n=1 Tax=Phenylobacterium sp. TaxID=1871053 RepID=UPI002FCA6B30